MSPIKSAQNIAKYFSEPASEVVEDDGFEIHHVAESLGKGVLRGIKVFSGIELYFSDFQITRLMHGNYHFDERTVEIQYCLEGMVIPQFKNRKKAQISSGDISLYGYLSGVDTCDFTKAPYKGITMLISVDEAIESVHQFTGLELSLIQEFFQRIINNQSIVVIRARRRLVRIFKEMYLMPQTYCREYLGLKVMEMLLHLIGEQNYDDVSDRYLPRTMTDRIEEVHDLLVEDLSQKITIPQLAAAVEMNTTDIKKAFKTVYGDTIYAYAKKMRMRHARELLLTTDRKVADIASTVGYANPSKFSQAFKTQYDSCPLAYRKANSQLT